MIVVFGSINADLVVAVPRLPGPGETVSGPDHQLFPGGKGANQALAAARAGAEVALLGAVGTDAFAAAALANLKGAVDLSQLRTIEGSTGLAMVAVASDGENQICVASGVNRRADADWLADALGPKSRLLVMQLELPLKEIVEAARLARGRGVATLLNAAPATGIRAEVLAAADILVVNETEAAELARVMGVDADPRIFARACVGEGCHLVVVTLGAAGCLADDGASQMKVAAPEVPVVDTTGAGDAFIGALAAALDRGEDTGPALRQAVAAGSLACTQTGAQSSLPDRAAIAGLAEKLTVETL